MLLKLKFYIIEVKISKEYMKSQNSNFPIFKISKKNPIKQTF